MGSYMSDGKKPIKMTYTGIRPGEKVHEIMVSEEECQRTARGNDFHVIQPVLPEIRRQPPAAGATEAPVP